MNDILAHAYVDRPCNACGGHYRVTLYEVLQEQRLAEHWKPRCEECGPQPDDLVRRIAPDKLEAVAAAWQDLAEDLQRHSINLQFD